MQAKELHLHLLLSRDDRKTLEDLAERWQVKLAEAIRRAVRETWRRENR